LAIRARSGAAARKTMGNLKKRLRDDDEAE